MAENNVMPEHRQSKEEIGKRYEETKKLLRAGIKDNSITYEIVTDKQCTCYFCNNRIKGSAVMLVLKEKLGDRELEGKFFIGENCFTLAHYDVPGDVVIQY